MSIMRLHWMRFIGAALALLFSILYLFGFERVALLGFLIIAIYGVFLGIRIQRGTQPARCDICKRKSILKVEYEPSYYNVRLILDCPHCGRVVNKSKNGVVPGLEEEKTVN